MNKLKLSYRGAGVRGKLFPMRQATKRIVLQLLRGYKWMVSPMLPPACRYVPTCSDYALEAVERYGVLRGGVMAAWRVLRCHPLAGGGYDPVARDHGDEAAGKTNFERPAMAPIEQSR